nr:isochorismatase family protein [Rhodococcus sp. (in: high G+C Gram-positive bacteria)]
MREHQDDDYAQSGFGHALTPGNRPALLLVDPVRAYIDPECSLYAGVEDKVEGMKVLLARARRSGIPVFVTEVSLRADGIDGGIFFRKVPALKAYFPGSPFAKIIDGVEPLSTEVLVTKHYPSAFFGTDLASMLTALRVDTLLIGGLSTSGCVRASTLDAMQYGFVPIVVEDAVGDRDPAVHESNLFDIRHKMGEVWTQGQVEKYLADLQ